MTTTRLLALAALAAGLYGCTSLDRSGPKACDRKTPYAERDAAGQYALLAEELRTIGNALQAYSRDHNGLLPPRLADLVAKRYLPAEALLSSADPTRGAEGGVPDSYREWGQAAETDEPGSSYLYEFSATPCKWEWSGYLGGKPGKTEIDADCDGAVSWSEVKNWQLLHGDTVQQPSSRPYSASQFPAVRCYWYQYPHAYTNSAGRTVLNLAADLRTVFASQPWWEKDQ